MSRSARTFLDAALAALQANSLAEAERTARAAVAASPRSATTHNVLGVVLDRNGKKEEAFSEFNTAVKLNPNFISARNNLGRMLAERGQTKAAIDQFEKVLKSDPSHIQALFNLGALYSDAGNFVEAAGYFERARAVQPDDPQLALAYLNVAYRADRRAAANSVAEWLEGKFAGEPKGLFTLGMILAQNKEYELARRLFEQVNKAMPRTYEVLYNLGIALYNLDRNDEAARHLAEAADLNPYPPEAHFRLGLIASARNDHANAVLEFKHAIERDEKNATYYYLLGREYFRVGFWEGAVNEYTTAIKLDPKQVAYVLGRANASYRKGEWTAAAIDFDLAASMDPTIKDIEYLRGYAHRAAGNFQVAHGLLQNVVAAQPDHVEALASLGYVAIEQGRFEEAEGPLKRALNLDPRNVPVLYDYARLAVKRRDYAEAATRLQKVIEKNPTHTQAHYQLFLVYSRLKQTDRAQVELAMFKKLEALEKQVQQERMFDERLRTQQMLGSIQ